VSAATRLAKLEDALSPMGATLLWLAEAHEFGSLPAYVAWLGLLSRRPGPASRGI